MQELSKKIIIMTEDRLSYQEIRHEEIVERKGEERSGEKSFGVSTSNAILVNA